MEDEQKKLIEKLGFRVKEEIRAFPGPQRWFKAVGKKRVLQQQVKVERKYNNGKIEVFYTWQEVPQVIEGKFCVS